MDINLMSRRELMKTPLLRHTESRTTFDNLILIPSKRNKLHDSGYRTMTFIAVKNNAPIYKMFGDSESIKIDGIGGYGKEQYTTNTKILTIAPTGWSIDCLAKSGLLRIWPSSNSMSCGAVLSNFEIFAE